MLVLKQDKVCNSSAHEEKMVPGNQCWEPVRLGLVCDYVKTKVFGAQKNSSQIDHAVVRISKFLQCL